MTATDAFPTTPVGARTSFADPPGRSPAMKQELEQLRQRGLTKSLNKHFTQECKKVEAELAAAEAALAELEARKANASEFKPNSNEITQLDMMCMKVAEWKKQCRKNEQETVMLYARYVEKFGDTIELAKPEELIKSGKVSNTATALVNADIDALVQAFEGATNEGHGIPDFLRPSEASAPSSFNTKELEEILEDASLPDPDAPCKALAATPQTAAMESDDDCSIVSGLTTLNSAVTREVLHDVENKVLDFIKSETENIRKMMEEDAVSKATPSIAMSHCSSQVEAVAEHEDMVKKMQQVLDDFKKVEEEQSLKSEKKGTTMVRRIEGGSEGEEWYEHFDETFQRPFYVEAKTKATQWHMPQSATDSSVMEASLSESADSTNTPTMAVSNEKVTFQEFIPDSTREGRRSKRVEVYRAKRRRQRKRQLVVSAVVLTLLGAGALYYKHTNPEQAEKAIQTVASALGWASSSTVDVEPKRKTKAGASQRTMPTRAVPKSEPVAGSGKVDPQEKDEVRAATPSPPKKVEPDTSFLREKAAPETPGETMGLALVKPKTQHWIMDVLVGPLAFKEVNSKCLDNARYCGTYHH